MLSVFSGRFQNAMGGRFGAFFALERYFTKVRLTPQNLHDEVVRSFNMEQFELEAQENFSYLSMHQERCYTIDGLEFQLPHSKLCEK
jgi:hypothetical protein